jgi:hypothetical protein
MGEYAKYDGRQIKIGTCEDMYYLRWDQRNSVQPESGSLRPNDPAVLKVIRFRFPWPDEDDNKPGDFDDFERSIPVDGLKIPAEVEHHSIQFTANYPKCGLLASLPCPQGPGPHPVQTHKNGWAGDVRLVQQAFRAGKLVSIFKCGGCGSVFRIEDVEQLAGMLTELRARSKRENSDFWAKVADRVEVGYYWRAVPVNT